jgi:biotin synthase
VIEAMKMENVLFAAADGVVGKVLAAKGESLAVDATRFCMGAAWRAPKDRDVEKVAVLVEAVKGLGLQTCATLGMLEPHHAHQLKAAGLDYYNHNLDTAPEYYTDIVDTRTYQDRLDTLAHVRSAGISVCCGGIVGMGEAPVHRAGLIAQLANLNPYPESVPINSLVRVPGTPLADSEPVDPFDFVRMIAVARITMPTARARVRSRCWASSRSPSAAPTSCACRSCGSTCSGSKSPAPSRASARTSTRTSAPSAAGRSRSKST